MNRALFEPLSEIDWRRLRKWLFRFGIVGAVIGYAFIRYAVITLVKAWG